MTQTEFPKTKKKMKKKKKKKKKMMIRDPATTNQRRRVLGEDRYTFLWRWQHNVLKRAVVFMSIMNPELRIVQVCPSFHGGCVVLHLALSLLYRSLIMCSSPLVWEHSSFLFLHSSVFSVLLFLYPQLLLLYCSPQVLLPSTSPQTCKFFSISSASSLLITFQSFGGLSSKFPFLPTRSSTVLHTYAPIDGYIRFPFSFDAVKGFSA